MDKIFWLYYKISGYFKAKIKRRIQYKYWQWKAGYECQSYGSFSVNGPTKLNKNTVLGNNVNFNGCKVYGSGNVNIGDNFHSGKNCMLITSFHNYEGTAIPYDNEVLHKDILIEDNVWLGNNVIILGGTKIGEGSIIQAGSVVVKEIPKFSIAGGHPAGVFSFRNKEHYLKLKAEGKFH